MSSQSFTSHHHTVQTLFSKAPSLFLLKHSFLVLSVVSNCVALDPFHTLTMSYFVLAHLQSPVVQFPRTRGGRRVLLRCETLSVQTLKLGPCWVNLGELVTLNASMLSVLAPLGGASPSPLFSGLIHLVSSSLSFSRSVTIHHAVSHLPPSPSAALD